MLRAAHLRVSRGAAALFLLLMLRSGLVTQGTCGICWGHQHRGGSAWAGDDADQQHSTQHWYLVEPLIETFTLVKLK